MDAMTIPAAMAAVVVMLRHAVNKVIAAIVVAGGLHHDHFTRALVAAVVARVVSGVVTIFAIVAARAEGGPFTSLFDFCARVDRTRINKRTVEDYFPSETHRMILTEPLRLTSTDEVYDVVCNIDGGGVSGQAGALRHGIARALIELDPELRGELKKAGFLTRDDRKKESKKYGLKKARKAPQYTKR